MNGKVSRRIRRAAWQVLHAGSKESYSVVVKRLKREYRALPYHRRDLRMYGGKKWTHREQDQRWREIIRWKEADTSVTPAQPFHDDHSHLRSISSDPEFYDDHSRFRNI